MSLASTTIRLGGNLPATEVAPHSPPTWETLVDGGNGEATFEFGRSAKFVSHLTKPDTLLEIFVGVYRVWFGRVADYDRQSGQVVGRGIHTDGLYIPSLTGGGAVTRTTQTAITTAQAPPWNWKVDRNSIAGTVTGSSTDPIMVWPLTQALAEQLGRRCYIDPNGAINIADDPTVPTWTITPDVAAFGPTGEGQSTALLGIYANGVSDATTLRPATIPDSAKAEIVDLRGRGTLTLAEANAILDGQLASSGKTGWVNGVTLHREQITRNGTPAFLPAVHARGHMARAQGVPVIFGAAQATWFDAVLAKTRYTAGDDVIYLEPTSTAPRTLTDVIAAS